MNDTKNRSAPTGKGQERSEECTAKREINLDCRKIAQIAVAAIDGWYAITERG